MAHIEKARSRGNRRFWKVAGERCGADGALLAAYHAWKTAKQDHEVEVAVDGSDQLAEQRVKLLRRWLGCNEPSRVIGSCHPVGRQLLLGRAARLG
jgi:hypothetical protein